MKIVIIGAGSMAFTPALLSGFSTDKRYVGATIGLVDVNEEALDVTKRVADRVNNEWDLHWTVEASTDRRAVLKDADIVTTSIGVGSLTAWDIDTSIPYRYGFIQPVGDTSGPGGLMRALRHIPVLVGIARDMEELCPKGTLYQFSNPLTVNTQAVTKLTKINCVGLCIGPELTWQHLCGVIGVDRARTTAVIGGVNHCHWMLDFRIDDRDAFPLLDAAFAKPANAENLEALRHQYGLVGGESRPRWGNEAVCEGLYKLLGYYPGPGDGHVAEFFPQFIQSARHDLETFHNHALKNCQRTYPPLYHKLLDAADPSKPLDYEAFAKEMSWEHTQLLDLLVSWQDNLGKLQYVNIPNRGYIHNLPEGTVVEIPVTVDAAGLHPVTLGDLPASVTPTLARLAANYDNIIEAAMTGSRRKAVQALVNDPYCTDLHVAECVVNELIDAELQYLPAFK